ncbi:nitroreductase family deazaflavin-dependent oxidoreductase [Nonomuraea africana]|uniref:Deazaflavin-dependent oxidoreductase (Nitroreductase family) n=1 Tax=Nonomuraea africana TaxID=46171 RepID=A0ABR9KVG1_9ACTN|nr:nitroreductase family deazaflavin-dependent oxidoreductase [Nonomuraea africana]MBE1565512.1 deazaflavin-dependent oxidoreductase (nitroreductase family) [Nonomuraea africana]
MNADVTDSPDLSVAEHVRRYLDSGGEDGFLEGGVTNLVLTTVGRKSGTRRRTGVFFGQDGERYILVASGSVPGAPGLPNWYLNLRANPEAEVQVRAERFAVRARTAQGAERNRLWRLMTSVAPVYRRYAALARQEIPVVVLERV